VQVRCSEGVAIHTGPESCAPGREARGEALTGGRMGQPSSRERVFFPGADVVNWTEGNMVGGVSASNRPARRGRRPWHVRTLLAREPGDLQSDHRPTRPSGPHREGEEP